MMMIDWWAKISNSLEGTFTTVLPRGRLRAWLTVNWENAYQVGPRLEFVILPRRFLRIVLHAPRQVMRPYIRFLCMHLFLDLPEFNGAHAANDVMRQHPSYPSLGKR